MSKIYYLVKAAYSMKGVLWYHEKEFKDNSPLIARRQAVAYVKSLYNGLDQSRKKFFPTIYLMNEEEIAGAIYGEDIMQMISAWKTEVWYYTQGGYDTGGELATLGGSKEQDIAKVLSDVINQYA